MKKNSKLKNCLEADEWMRVIRENLDSDKEKAKEAFGNIYSKYNAVLWWMCSKACGDRANADLVYDSTWKRIWNHPDYDFKRHGVEFVTWMARIAHNVWVDVKKKQVQMADDAIDDLIQTEVGEEEEEVIPSFNMMLIEGAMAELTEKERDILKTYIVYDTDKMKHVPSEVLDDLKERYQTTSVNLRKIKSRALEKVRDYISKHQ